MNSEQEKLALNHEMIQNSDPNIGNTILMLLSANFGTQLCLTRQFHHDSGHVLIAVFPPRGEYGALGRRLRRGQQCYSGVINALRAWNEILLARVEAVSLVGETQAYPLVKHQSPGNTLK